MAILRFLLPILFFPAIAEDQPTANALLAHVRQIYFTADHYHFVARVVENRQGVQTTGSEEIAVDKRGRVWFKAMDYLAFAWSGGREEKMLIAVADGEDTWVYLKQQNLYKKTHGVPDSRNTESGDDNIDNPKSFIRKLRDRFLRYTKFQSLSSRAQIVTT